MASMAVPAGAEVSKRAMPWLLNALARKEQTASALTVYWPELVLWSRRTVRGLVSAAVHENTSE